MTELLQKLAPRKLEKVLKTYLKTWAQNRQGEYQATPLISFYLSHGNLVSGEIIHIDFEDRMLSMRILGENNRLDVMFLNFDLIQSFILHDLEKCPVFVEELAKIN